MRFYMSRFCAQKWLLKSSCEAGSCPAPEMKMPIILGVNVLIAYLIGRLLKKAYDVFR
jgi:hypothetical protein